METLQEIVRLLKILRPWPGWFILAILLIALFFQVTYDLLHQKRSKKRKKEERKIAFFD